MLNYRIQLTADTRGTPAFAPRISLILPTGDSSRGLGEPGVRWQVNLPFAEQSRDVYLHWNVGFTKIASVARPHVGGSAIWRASPMLHAMMETLIEGADRVTISPGIRVGWNRGEA